MTSKIISHLPKRYIPTGESGSGGFGDVIFCNDIHLNRLVAIKTIKNISELSRLQDEISALLKLRSKHVVQVFDIIESDDSFGIVMEYIDGEDLFKTDEYKKSDIHLLKVLWQIAMGIADIHDAGLIHRDIKPNNMKLDGEGVLKIFDFGLSRNTGVDASTIGFIGTFGFSSPEQYSHSMVEFTSAIGVYAFGATALFLSKGDLPDELKSCPPKPLALNSFDCDFLNKYPTLKNLFEQCLSQLPEDRPEIHQVRDEISRYLLFDNHQAVAVLDNNKVHVLNNKVRKVTPEFV